LDLVFRWLLGQKCECQGGRCISGSFCLPRCRRLLRPGLLKQEGKMVPACQLYYINNHLHSPPHRYRKTFFTFFIIFIKNAFFTFFYFWNVFYFLVENFCILLNPLKSY